MNEHRPIRTGDPVKILADWEGISCPNCHGKKVDRDLGMDSKWVFTCKNCHKTWTYYGKGVEIQQPPINSLDPWIHRSEGMRCVTCMWFAPKGDLGRCRRHAPTMNGYPVVFENDWCGDHKLKEKKR